MVLAKFLLLLACFSKSISHTLSCICEDPQSQSVWGKFTPTSLCAGGCDGTKIGKRVCHLNINGTVQPPTTCIVSQYCVVKEGCIGRWSSWEAQDCSSGCVRVSQRNCFQVEPPFRKIASTLCPGAKGQTVQRKTSFCHAPGCNATYATLPKETTVPQRTRTLLETFQPLETTDVTTDFSSSTENAGFGGNEKEVPSGLDIVTLGIILGCIALVCVTIIAVVIVVQMNRRKNPRTDYPSYNSVTTVPIVTDSLSPIRNHNYSEIGPALPERPSARGQHPPSNEHPTMVENSLYQSLSITEEQPIQNTGRSTDDGGYLLPLPSTSSFMEPDSAYSTIDINR